MRPKDKLPGTIEKHGKRWRVRFSMPDGSRRSFYTDEGASREDAEALRAALLLELAGTLHDPAANTGGATLGAWGLQWIERERARTHRDADGDLQRWRAYVIGTSLADRRLSALTPADLRRWAKAMASRTTVRGEGIARQTVRNAWTTVRAVIRAAGEHEPALLESAPLLAVELPRGDIEQEVELEEGFDVLSMDEVDRVLAVEDLDDDQRSAFVVGVYTGLRAGELHGLAWERCTLEGPRPELVVARSRRGAVKAGKVKRTPLLEPARAALHTRWVAAGRPATGLVWPIGLGMRKRGDDFGWRSQRENRELGADALATLRGRAREVAIIGEPMRIADDRWRVLLEWHGVRARAGIDRAITWHEATRHTCASQLLMGVELVERGVIERPWRLEEVSRLLRHSSTAVTQRHYARFLAGALPVQPPSPRANSAASAEDVRRLVEAVERLTVGAAPSAVPAVPNPFDSSSRPRELNPGPTVYEAVALPGDLGDVRDPWDSKARELAVEILRCVAEHDGKTALMHAVTLATRITDAAPVDYAAEQRSSR